jgi:hypothetical protein
MTLEQLAAIQPQLRAYAEAIRTLRKAFENADGRVVKAECMAVAVACFKLGEAAEQESDQKYMQ